MNEVSRNLNIASGKKKKRPLFFLNPHSVFIIANQSMNWGTGPNHWAPIACRTPWRKAEPGRAPRWWWCSPCCSALLSASSWGSRWWACGHPPLQTCDACGRRSHRTARRSLGSRGWIGRRKEGKLFNALQYTALVSLHLLTVKFWTKIQCASKGKMVVFKSTVCM